MDGKTPSIAVVCVYATGLRQPHSAHSVEDMALVMSLCSAMHNGAPDPLMRPVGITIIQIIKNC